MAFTSTTVSPPAMLAALVDGERDARMLPQLAKGKMRAKVPELNKALIGPFDAGRALLARAQAEHVSGDSGRVDTRTASDVRAGRTATHRNAPGAANTTSHRWPSVRTSRITH